VILAAAYLLWLYQRVFFGQNNNPKNANLKDLSAREMATFVPLVVLAFAIGLYPKPLFQILAVPVNNLVATVRPDYPGVTKPVVAGEPAKTTDPNAATPLPEAPKAPAVKSPATTGNAGDTGVTKKQAPAPVKTAQVNSAAATTAGGK
jgi:NADH-quinone oxidoreductase subunit M